MKTCIKCNAEYSEEISSCSNCGASVFRHVVSPTLSNNVYDDNSGIDFKYQLGGWLSVFITAFMGEMILKSFTVYSLIQELIASRVSIFANDINIVTIELILSLLYPIIMVPFGVFITINYYKKKKRTPKFILIYLLVDCIYYIYKLIITQNFLLLEYQGIVESRLFGEIINCIVWIMYFLSSKRVKNAFTD